MTFYRQEQREDFLTFFFFFAIFITWANYRSTYLCARPSTKFFCALVF